MVTTILCRRNLMRYWMHKVNEKIILIGINDTRNHDHQYYYRINGTYYSACIALKCK